jgi:hypothetical protein
MAEVNKAKKNQSTHNKGKYTAQYGITWNNKRRAIAKHLTVLKAALVNATERKAKNITAAIAAAEVALKSLPLKKGG